MRDIFNRTVNAKIAEDQYAVLERRAKELGGNISTALRAIITEWAREHNGKAPKEEEQAE